MARARGANAVMAAVFEATYGVTPGTGFRKLPFVSANLGEEQSLIESDLLGYVQACSADNNFFQCFLWLPSFASIDARSG
jgi:hypothetical protein